MRATSGLLLILFAGCASGEARGDVPADVPAEAELAETEAAPAAEASAEAEPPSAETTPPAAAGWFAEATLENAAFHTPGSPSVVVHAPPGFDPRAPLNLVIFLHGWRGCARQLAHAGEVVCRDGARPVAGWDLAGRFDEAGVNALFVVPQLAFLVRDGSAGRFVEQGRFAAFLEEMLGALRDRIGPPVALSRVASITLLAHSAGYETTLAVISRGGVDGVLESVVLFDALYRGHNRFAEWVLADADHRLVSLHGAEGRTVSQSRLLVGRLRGSLGAALSDGEEGALSTLIRAHRLTVARASAAHGDIPAHHMVDVLRGLLPAGPGG